MSGPAKTTKTKATGPAVVPFVLAAVQPPPAKDPPAESPSADNAPPSDQGSAAKTDSMPAAGKTTLLSFEGVAVLALGEAGEILAARDACLEVFGWEATALVGQNIRVLLKGGLDNDVGRFLHRHRAGKNPTGTIALRVWGVRKDGTEFPAQVTTLTWNWGTAVTTKGDVSRLCWTAAFRDLSAATTPGQATSKEGSPTAENGSEPPALVMAEDANQSAPASTPTDIPPSSPEPKDRLIAPAAQSTPDPGPERKKKDKAPTADEQVAIFELKQRIKELEGQLSKAAAEAAHTRVVPDSGHESELQTQLAAARAAAENAEATLREETTRREKLEERLQTLSSNLRLEQAERSKRFEETLVGLRQERDELNTRLAAEQQGAVESTRRAEELEARLGRNEEEFQRAKAELEKQTAERQQSESSWREQFDTVWIAKKEVEGAFAGAVERNKHFEEELAKLRQEHDELKQKLTAEQKSAADAKQRAQEVAGRLTRNAASSDRARADLEKENAERERADNEWRQQLEAAKALKIKLEASLTEAANHCKRLEEEVTGLRKERDELQKRVKSEQQIIEESSRRAGELQRRTDQDSSELERLTAELEKQTVERERVESRVREQQEAAKALARKLEADWAGAVERNVQFEEELVEIRRSRDELSLQLKAEQQSSIDAAQRIEELERRIERSAAELKRVASESETLRVERERADSEGREQLEAAKALARKLDAAWTGATERNRRLEGEAADLRQEREELLGKLAVAHRDAAEAGTRVTELENQMRSMTAEADRVTVASEGQSMENINSSSLRNPSSELHAPSLRRDLNQQNGHGNQNGLLNKNPESSPAVVPGARSKTTGQSAQIQTDSGTPGHPAQVESYNFDFSAGKPARRDPASPKKRQP